MMNKYMFRFLFAGIVLILFAWAAPSAMIKKDIIAKFWFTDLAADTISLFERIIRISMVVVAILNVLYFIIAREEEPDKKDFEIINFNKETAHRYSLKNQNGLIGVFGIVKEGFKDVWSSPPYRWYFRVMVILTILTILYVIGAIIKLTVR
jgi:hypothetical protein